MEDNLPERPYLYYFSTDIADIKILQEHSGFIAASGNMGRNDKGKIIFMDDSNKREEILHLIKWKD